MTIELPEFLESGEPARLIPVSSSPHRERSAASVLLATLCVVQPFAEAAFGTLRKRIGNMTSVEAFTEVVLKKQLAEANCRPDGLIVLRTPRSEWRALVEAKIGTAGIKPAQLSLYCKLAALNEIDAIITISNELTSFPEHLPYELPRDCHGKTAIFHWSWMTLITMATMLISTCEGEFDPEQHFLLKEMLRYFSHENTDVRGFHQMNSEWPALLERVHSGAEIRKDHSHVLKTVASWHQEQSDICLLLSRKLKVPVTLRLKKYHRDNQASRLANDAEEFAATKQLYAVFEVPNLAGPIEVVADALRRNVTCRMCVQAPEDKKRYESRLNWLLRQLPDDTGSTVGIHIQWKNGGSSFGWVPNLRENPGVADIERPGALPKSFEILALTDLGRKFAGTRNFIDILEEAVPQFYDAIARHIRAWQPSPVSATAEGPETLTDTVANLPDPKKTPKRVVRRGRVSGGQYSVFEDGSIEVETANGVLRFGSFAELAAHAKPTKGPGETANLTPRNESSEDTPKGSVA